MRDTVSRQMLDEQPFFDPGAVRKWLETVDAVELRAQRDQAFMMLTAPTFACILQGRYRL